MRPSTNIFALFVIVFGTLLVSAQSSEFTYQGSLKDGGSLANGNYDFQFLLFDDPEAGSQLGTTIFRNNVVVSNGIFSAKLDFGNQFTGAERYIEIRVRLSGTAGTTILGPRQAVGSVPYSVKSLAADNAANAANASNAANSSQLGGLPPSRYVQTDVNGNVGIGSLPASGSKLTVGGQIELTSGAVKFPDATTQSTAGIASVSTTPPLIGNGTASSPLGITTPLPIRDTENPARQPIFFSRTGAGDAYTVPAGKRLVIEFISTSLILPASTPMPFIQFGGSGSAGTHLIAPEGFRDGGINKSWIFSKAVRLYVAAGGTVFVSFSDVPTIPNPIFFTGHLLDIP